MTRKLFHQRLGVAACRHLFVCGTALAVLGLTACNGDTVHAPAPNSTVVWRLAVDHEAVTMAVGDTLQLQVTPRGRAGAPLPVPGPITWTSNVSSAVRVDSNGVLHALAEVQGVQITATLQDTVLHQLLTTTVGVNVTPTAAPLTSFVFDSPEEIDPFNPPPFPYLVAGDPIAIGIRRTLAVRAMSGTDTVPVAFSATIANNRKAMVQPWNQSRIVFAQDTGETTVYLRTFAYGVEYLDSVRVRVALSDSVVTSFISRVELLQLLNGGFAGPGDELPALDQDYFFVPKNVTIRVNGSVTFVNAKPNPQSLFGLQGGVKPTAVVHFEDLTNVSPSADVEAIPIEVQDFGTQVFYPEGPPPVRYFTAVGTYRWSSPTTGQSGIITVVP